MWVSHKSKAGDFQLGDVSVAGTYTGVPDMTMGVNVTHGSGNTNFQVGMDCDCMDGGVAMDNNMNMTVNHTQSYGDNVTMENWFRLPVKEMMGANMNQW